MARRHRWVALAGLVVFGFAIPVEGQAAGAVHQSAETAFGPITGGGNCSSALGNETPARQLADTLDDAWFVATGRDAVDVALFPDADIGSVTNNYSLAFPTIPVSVEIGKFDISKADALSTDPSSFGTIDDAGGTDPSLLIGGSEQMQDCAPKPLSLVSSAEGGPLPAPTPYWNAVGFAADQTTLDSVLFSFSTPVDNFGAWFGDLETRVEDATTGPDDGGELAYVKLYAADGTVLALEPVLPNNQRAVTNDVLPPGDPGFDDDGFGCGDQDQNEDFSSCGNHGTRFLGFVWPTASVAYMQVIVGDDDHCNEVNSCMGLTEHLSFIGPQIAYENPELLLAKTVVNDDLGTLLPGDFALTLIEDPDGAATETTYQHGDVVELVAGTPYQVTEASVAGYDLISIECRDDADTLLTDVFAPTFDQRVTCTVVNDDVPAPTTTTSAPTPPTTAPATTASPTTTPSVSEPVATSPTPSDPTTTVGNLPVTGGNTDHLLGLGWLLLAVGSMLWAVTLRRPVHPSPQVR